MLFAPAKSYLTSSLFTITSNFAKKPCLLFRLGFAVETAILALDGVGEGKDMRQFLLRGGDATGVLAEDDACQTLGKGDPALFPDLAVTYDDDGDAGIDIAEDLGVHLDVRVDLDEILASHFAADRILDESDRAVQLVQLQKAV